MSKVNVAEVSRQLDVAHVGLLKQDLVQTPQDLQGHSALRINDTFCCLGRGCEVFRRETGKGEWVPLTRDEQYSYMNSIEASARARVLAEYGDTEFTVYRFVIGAAQGIGVLPMPVVEWFGFGRDNPTLPVPYDLAEKLHAPAEDEDQNVDTSAAALNDDHRLSFADIGRCFGLLAQGRE